MTPAETEKVEKDAVRKAKIDEVMKKRTWYIEARVGSNNYRGDVVHFIDDRRGTDGGYDNMRAEEYVAGLLVDQEALIEQIAIFLEYAERYGCIPSEVSLAKATAVVFDVMNRSKR
jgi:hypothetical protein